MNMSRFFPLVLLVALSGCASDLVASINGRPLQRTIFEQALRIELMKHDPIVLRDPPRLQAMKTQVLDQLVTDTLLYDVAVQQGIQPTDEELTEAYDQFKGRYTETAFQEMLRLKGIDYAVWKHLRKQRYVIERLVEQKFTAADNQAPDGVEAYYREHRPEFVEPESVRVRQIVTENEATAKMLREKILKGANFAQLALEYSLTPDGKDGGDLGYIPRGSFPAVFDQVCFRLPVGAMSDVVKSEYGYHLFKVLDRRPGQVIPLQEARPRIVERLRAEAVHAAYTQWTATLRQRAKITIHKDAIAAVRIKE